MNEAWKKEGDMMREEKEMDGVHGRDEGRWA